MDIPGTAIYYVVFPALIISVAVFCFISILSRVSLNDNSRNGLIGERLEVLAYIEL